MDFYLIITNVKTIECARRLIQTKKMNGAKLIHIEFILPAFGRCSLLY